MLLFISVKSIILPLQKTNIIAMAKIVFKELTSNQNVLFPVSLSEKIAPNHPVRIVNSVVDALDISSLLSSYKGGGTSSYHPRMMLKVLFYAYLNNIYSCRKIEKALQENIHFMWLSGNSTPDFRTINDFRGKRLKEDIKSLFSAIVLLLQESGYVSLDVQYIDGTKVESASNRYTFVWRGSVEKNKVKLESKIQSILSEVDKHIEQDKQERTPDCLPDMDSCGLREKVSALNKRLSGMNNAEQKQIKKLQEEYLLLVNNDIKSVVELVDFISEKEDRIQQIADRQKEIYRESSSRKRSIKNEEQYREYQIWHVEVQEELDELKQEKRKIKRQIQLADDIIKEDLYTAYYAVSGNEEIVVDRDVEIPGMDEETEVEKATAVVVEHDANVDVMNPNNKQNEIGRLREQADSARKQQTDLDGIGKPEIHNSSDVNVTRMDESITDVTDKSEFVGTRETESVDKTDWIVRRISEFGGYENVSDSVKADIFGFDIADVSGSIRLFSDVMKRLGIKLD